MRPHNVSLVQLVLASCAALAGCGGESDVIELRVHDPAGAVEVTQLHADRLFQIDSATLCELSDFMWEANRILPEIRGLIGERYPGAVVVPYTELPDAYQADPEALTAAVQNHGCQAVIVSSAG